MNKDEFSIYPLIPTSSLSYLPPILCVSQSFILSNHHVNLDFLVNSICSAYGIASLYGYSNANYKRRPALDRSSSSIFYE